MRPPRRYEIRVSGVVGPAARLALGQLEMSVEPPVTVLSGTLDQAGLHEVVDRIEELGLELIDVRRLPSDPRSVADSLFPGLERPPSEQMSGKTDNKDL